MEARQTNPKIYFPKFYCKHWRLPSFYCWGKPLGAIKRTPASGDFRANVSQGGGVFHETDVKILSELYQIAVNVSSLFDLQICGVDIIHNEETKQFQFLEVNTVPQWQGFKNNKDTSSRGDSFILYERVCGTS